MKKRRLSDKTLFIIVIASIIAVMSLFIYKKASSYIHVNKEIENINIQIKDYESKIKSYSVIHDNLLGLMTKEEKIKKLIPDKRGESDIVKCITDMGMQNDVNITGVNFQNDEKKDDYVRAPIKINEKGKYSSAIKFISEVSNTGRMFKIDTLKFTPNQTEGDLLKIEIDASAYYTEASK